MTLGTVLAFLCLVPEPAGLLAATIITVTNANDSGAGSLRDAINAANTSTPPVTIQFAIPPTNSVTVKTISLYSALPSLASSIVIDGYTQPGASPNTLTNGDNAVLLIQLSPYCGEGCYYGQGLTITGTASTVRGLVINEFHGGGILVEDSGSNNVIEGNFIGTDPTGTYALGNGFYEVAGVEVDGCSNTVGGAAFGARNVVSGNTADGIDIYGDSNTVLGNFIGTDVTGTNALGNGVTGVYLGGSSNAVGGANAGAGNVVSGNYGDGVDVYGNSNTVLGNFIGTDATGANVIGNGGGDELRFAPVRPSQIGDGGGEAVGVLVSADHNVISNNVISGNGIGIYIDGVGASADFNVVQGNRIGTDVTGTLILSNSLSGVFIDGELGEGEGEAFSNLVGGVAVGEYNIIAGSGSNGVVVVGASAMGNAVLGNSIFSNAALGIDLGDDGVTTNDACDPDVGPNQLQNFPVLLLAAASSSSLTISGSLNSVGSTLYRLEFFANSACNPSGYGEGETFIGSTNVTTQPSTNCSVEFGVTFPVSGLTTNDVITATATDPFWNTSEFSPCLRVTSANHSPVAICRNVTVTADANCQASVTANQVNNGSYDPDNDPITLSFSPPGPYSVGVRSVTLIVVDSSGASNTCSATITVLDQTPPTIACPPTKIVNADAGKCSASNVNLGTPTVSDNCGVAGITGNAPASFPVGTNTVTWTVTDVHGNTNSCQQLVIVNDNQPPAITCPAPVTVPCASAVPAPDTSLVTAADNCGTVTVSFINDVITNRTCANRFTVIRTYRATDSAHNSSTCQQTITVNDTAPPTITCPADVTTNTDVGQCFASGVALGSPAVSDDCGGAVTVTNGAPGTFAQGTNLVVWTATDACGNSSTCTQNVIVIDNEPPTIICPASITVTGTIGTASTVVTFTTPTATDNCSTNVSVVSSPASGSHFPFGTNTVTSTAVDRSGNSNSCAFSVTVIPPAGPDLSGFWTATTAFRLNRNNYIFGAFQVINQGTELASNSLLRVYRSTSSSSTNGTVARLFKTFRIPRLDAGQTNPPSVCGIKLPRGVNSTNQFLIAVVDASNKVLESNEGNNMISVQPTNFVPPTIGIGSFMETVHRAKGH
jgi:parallel beta-helix repeat protein